MYINPFVAGVLTTLFAECVLVIIYAVVSHITDDDKPE